LIHLFQRSNDLWWLRDKKTTQNVVQQKCRHRAVVRLAMETQNVLNFMRKVTVLADIIISS
jgi:hypothetical protein